MGFLKGENWDLARKFGRCGRWRLGGTKLGVEGCDVAGLARGLLGRRWRMNLVVVRWFLGESNGAAD